MSIQVFHGGVIPQAGKGLISPNLGKPTIFLPRAQVGYGLGGVLKPLARTVFAAAKGQLKKLPKYLGKLVKKHGKKTAKQVVAAAISGQLKKGQRKQTLKRIAATNIHKAQQNIKKDIKKAVQKSVKKQKSKLKSKPKAKKTSVKRKALFLPYRRKSLKKRRKDIFDK